MVAKRAFISNGLYMTEEQYLALDDATDGNYEFYDGYVIMLSPPSAAYDGHAPLDLAGGSVAHSAICARLVSLIDQRLQNGPCLVHTSDVKVKAASQHNYFHPDVVVTCSEESGQVVNHPVVVLEVLSPSTEKRDRGPKLQAYKDLPSVQEYVLVGSTFREIIIYQRENGWKPFHYRSGDQVEFKSIGVNFLFDEVYSRIPL